MKILTVENETYELDDIPDTIDDLRYSILDYSNPGFIDYYLAVTLREFLYQTV